MQQTPNTSWNAVNAWYDALVGTEGHYYHKHVILPGVIRLLDVQPTSTVIDFGCGQGILAHALPTLAGYLGVDASAELISQARKYCQQPNYTFLCKDVTKPMRPGPFQFSHAVFMLSLQNMRDWDAAMANAAQQLNGAGTLVLVLNHPCFRIPRQSGWGVDEKTKQQYRWVNRYISPLEIPITMSPRKRDSRVTWSFHHALQDLIALLCKHGFVLTALEEWTSDKHSSGSAAKMENRARGEFPLFMAIRAQQLPLSNTAPLQ